MEAPSGRQTSLLAPVFGRVQFKNRMLSLCNVIQRQDPRITNIGPRVISADFGVCNFPTEE